MDREQLKQQLLPFVKKCEEKKMPISICIEDAFPGDISTSYIVQVTAPWVDTMDCSHALDFLFGILWETTDIETRKKIFSIQVLDSKDQFHCYSDNIVSTTNLAIV